MIPEGLREEAERFVVRYVFGYFRRERDAPSVAKICEAVERKFKRSIDCTIRVSQACLRFGLRVPTHP